ncbi:MULTISPECIES: DUF1073 domain-containing protein [unclassified Saccharibacter]|uniref:phage portal protein n=1 Tax=unclassified Saccharibacter TaxID=2648722 RepID=UPI00132763E4|nr:MULTISPECIES: DUF1073 domain-containing protein [unclassified Saccharibacter]MXV35970.1 DUF1073 domain-containing protein [Saccharibacter sp. EH611]MXV58925.1 DUF1073 domain-containing protein [Saccharibacter sp. EH70]
MSLFRKKATPPSQRREPVVHPTSEEKPRSWLSSLFGHYTAEDARGDGAPPLDVRLAPCKPAPGVVPERQRLANDSALDAVQGQISAYAAGNAGAIQSWLADGLGFMGYPYLSQMAMRAEFRKPCDIIAREATREWIRFKSTKNINITDYDTDEEANAAREQQSRETAEKISAIEAEFKRLDVRALLYRQVLSSLLNGVGYLWIDIVGLSADATGQNVPLKINEHGVKKGSLNGFKIIDPVWTSPNYFNADSPYRAGFYDPDNYWVQGCLTHKDRLLKMVPYEVPDIFKPAFNFGGLSLTQQLRPYVHNFLRTRNSVSDITANFSKLVLKTDMTAAMQGGVMDHNGTSTIMGRASFMQQVSEGQSTIVADKENEEVSIVATPLGGLSDLQAQSMEAMASIPGIPLVKLFGITPNGLNASSEGEIRVFYDEIAAFQENNLRPILEKILRLIQLNLWGEIDESLDFDFVNLWQLDDEKAASVEKAKAEADKINIEAGKITPDEARMREEQDQNSLYRGVNLSGEAPGIPETEPPNLGGSEGDSGESGAF